MNGIGYCRVLLREQVMRRGWLHPSPQYMCTAQVAKQPHDCMTTATDWPETVPPSYPPGGKTGAVLVNSHNIS